MSLVRFNFYINGEMPWQAVVGDVLRLRNGEIYLVGDVNEMGGICDDCKGIYYGEEVEHLGNIIDTPALIYVLEYERDRLETKEVNGR